MNSEPYIAEPAALIGDPARANILLALMDGRALTATELAHVAGVTPQTASSHLAKLSAGQLVVAERQGRHRYYRLAGEAVARTLEALMELSRHGPVRYKPTGPRDAAMRKARTCYDHLAGELGVCLTQRLVTLGYLTETAENFDLTREGRNGLNAFGIDLDIVQRRKRAFCRRCLDWSERKAHLGGALGAALLDRIEHQGWLRRSADSRAIRLTPAGREGLRTQFDLELKGF